MKRVFLGRNRLLLFRSYLFLVASLLVVAIVLDYGFNYLQSSQAPDDEQWIKSTFELIERELAASPSGNHDLIAADLRDDLGFGVQVLQIDDVAANGNSRDEISTLVDREGNTSHLRHASSINAVIRLGPMPEQEESALLRLLPPLFYLSIFAIVGIWLRPLLNDIKLISHGARRFAADYREPLATAGKVTELKGLAGNIDEMSARLSGLIQSQKELIAALSHEMRTPLARIRFAIAVIDNKENADLHEQLDAISADVLEIDKLIASMLNYARLDHPELRMHWHHVPIEAWVRQIQEKCEPPNKQVAFASDAVVDEAWMDPRLMGLALSNLMVNAYRYADSKVLCTVSRQDGDYRVTVEDDGEGIADSERDGVFKAFARIDDSRNRETGGYGLGLAIVARIAALHGGTARVEASAKLGGARFMLTWRAPVEESG